VSEKAKKNWRTRRVEEAQAQADDVSQDPLVCARRAAAVAQLSKFYKHGQQRQLVTAVVAFVASEASTIGRTIFVDYA
jgi:hypothetical protein